MAAYKTISFKAIDIGFDLRNLGVTINRPEVIGSPSEFITVVWDEGSKTGRACDCGSALRKAGFKVAASWFAGRENWGQPVVPVGSQAETKAFEIAGALEAEQKRKEGTK